MTNKTLVIGTAGISLIAALVAVTLLAAGGDIARGGVVADLIMLAGIIAYAPPAVRMMIEWFRPKSTLLAGYGWDAQSAAIAGTLSTGYSRVRRAHRQTFAGLQQRGAIGTDLQRATPTDRRGTGRQAGGSGTAARQAAGGKNADDDGGGDGEPPRPLLALLDQTTLAALLCVSKKTLQNQYSATPWLLPPAIQIPGARGPRWTPQSVQQWLGERPKHTPPQSSPPRKKRGRPRIAPQKPKNTN